jgi:hypothetical protein
VARSDLSRHSKRALQPFDDKITVTDETYTVAFQSNNQAFAAEAVSFHSEASARDYLSRKVTEDAALADALHVIPNYERAA